MYDTITLVFSVTVTIVAVLLSGFYVRSRLHKTSGDHCCTKSSDGVSADPQSTTDDPKASADTDSKINRWPISEGTTTTPEDATAAAAASATSEPLVRDSAIHDDPVNYCEHIQSQVKRTKQRIAMQKIEAEMTREEKEMERKIQRQQIEAIFKAMEKHKDAFGMSSIDEVEEQVRMYVPM